MLMLSGKPRLFLYHQPMNMRKSFEGLSVAIEKAFPKELLSGAYFIFVNRKKDHMKVLYWDIDGLVIWFKRLEKGTFSVDWKETSRLDRRAFFMLLEGVIPKRFQRRFSL